MSLNSSSAVSQLKNSNHPCKLFPAVSTTATSLSPHFVKKRNTAPTSSFFNRSDSTTRNLRSMILALDLAMDWFLKFTGQVNFPGALPYFNHSCTGLKLDVHSGLPESCTP